MSAIEPISTISEKEFANISKIEEGKSIEGFKNDAYLTEASSSEPPPPPYNEVTASDKERRADGDGMEIIQKESDDEKILSVLREIVRKCTLANPLKRPTAREVLKMLEEVAPKELLADKFNISDDEDDFDDKKKRN